MYIFSNSHFSICSDIQVMYQNLAKVVTEKARVKAIEKFKREFEVEECLLDAAWNKDNDIANETLNANDPGSNPWKVYLVQYIKYDFLFRKITLRYISGISSIKIKVWLTLNSFG